MPLAAFDPSPTPFVVLMGVGFLVGTIGHVYKSKTLIATGIGLIFMATWACRSGSTSPTAELRTRVLRGSSGDERTSTAAG